MTRFVGMLLLKKYRVNSFFQKKIVNPILNWKEKETTQLKLTRMRTNFLSLPMASFITLSTLRLSIVNHGSTYTRFRVQKSNKKGGKRNPFFFLFPLSACRENWPENSFFSRQKEVKMQRERGRGFSPPVECWQCDPAGTFERWETRTQKRLFRVFSHHGECRLQLATTRSLFPATKEVKTRARKTTNYGKTQNQTVSQRGKIDCGLD